MKYKSVFEIIGPVMVGPSSSHTAGAVRIGQIARRIFGMQPEKIEVHFYGSFADTYKGHATDVAIISGILDFETDDKRIPDAIEIAGEWGINIQFFKEEAIPAHPNTVKIQLLKGYEHMHLTGISIGGGSIQITDLNGFSLNLSGERPSVLILHRDVYGMVAAVTSLLTTHKINISHMELSRLEKGQMALMVIESDEQINDALITEIGKINDILKVIVLQE